MGWNSVITSNFEYHIYVSAELWSSNELTLKRQLAKLFLKPSHLTMTTAENMP